MSVYEQGEMVAVFPPGELDDLHLADRQSIQFLGFGALWLTGGDFPEVIHLHTGEVLKSHEVAWLTIRAFRHWFDIRNRHLLVPIRMADIRTKARAS